MTKNFASEAPPARPPTEPLAEHALVRTREMILCDGIKVPAGTIGTIVFVHAKDDAFEVELEPPFEAVVSVFRRQVEAA